MLFSKDIANHGIWLLEEVEGNIGVTQSLEN